MRINRQKVTYQRNMMIGQAVAIVLSSALGLFISLAYGPADSYVVRGNTKSGHGKVARAFSRVLPPGLSLSSGFESESLTRLQFGRNPVLIDDSYPVPIKSRITEEISVLALIPDSIDSDLFGSSVLGGEPFLDESYLSAYREELNEPPKLLNRSVKIINYKRPDYPFTAKYESQEGEVRFLLLIDSLGQRAFFPFQVEGQAPVIVNHLVLKEEPTNWFFARNAYDAIEDWQFGPAVENGLVVTSYIKIRINYCLSEGCLWLLVERADSD